MNNDYTTEHTVLCSANIWLDTEQLDETLSTLKFAQRMMNVPVEPVVRQLFNPLVRPGPPRPAPSRPVPGLHMPIPSLRSY